MSGNDMDGGGGVLHYFDAFSPSIFPEMCSLPKEIERDIPVWHL